MGCEPQCDLGRGVAMEGGRELALLLLVPPRNGLPPSAAALCPTVPGRVWGVVQPKQVVASIHRCHVVDRGASPGGPQNGEFPNAMMMRAAPGTTVLALLH